MPRIVHITPDFAVTGALAAEDLAEVAQLGFKTVINNRPDGEEAGQLAARQGQLVAGRAGLGYRHVPVVKHEVFSSAVVAEMSAALAGTKGPVLAHCKSGQRSALVWAAVQARAGRDIDAVLAVLAEAGFDLAVVRDELVEVAAAAATDDRRPVGPSQAAA